MKDYVIVTDSTTDLPNSFAEENNLVVLPLTFRLENKDYKNYLDNRDLSPKEFYEKMRNGNQPVTAQVNSEEFIELATPILEKGLDILYVGFSSALSGTYNSIRLGTEELIEKFPKAKIKLVDSKLASMGEGLLVHYAVEYKKQGLSLEEIVPKLEEQRGKITSWFTVSDIETLRRGGRVSNVGAFVAKALKIKPILHVDEEGRLIARTKKIGRKQSLNSLLDEILERIIVEENEVVFISHGDSLEDANYIKEKIEEKTKIKKFIINEIGPVIGAHSGPDTIAVFVVGKGK